MLPTSGSWLTLAMYDDNKQGQENVPYLIAQMG